MTQPFAEWLAEVKTRLAAAATSKEWWRITLHGLIPSGHGEGFEAAVKAQRDFDTHAAADLARAVEELEKPVIITEEMVEGAAQALCALVWGNQGEARWEADREQFCEEARVALEAALRKDITS